MHTFSPSPPLAIAAARHSSQQEMLSDRPPRGQCQHRLGTQPYRGYLARSVSPPAAGQRRAEGTEKTNCEKARPDILDSLLQIPVTATPNWTDAEKQAELDNNAQVEETFERMAAKVDEQNAGDKLYTPMVGNFKGAAYQAATELVFKGLAQPSGHTEPLLHAWCLKVKAAF